MNRAKSVVIGAVAAVVGGMNHPVSSQEGPRSAIVVAAYDYAGVPPAVIAGAREKVASIFGKAGIDILWSAPAPGIVRSDRGPVECRQPFVIQVMIRSRQAEWEPGRRRIMGVALAADRERGVLSLFYDAIHDVARRYGTPVDDVLAVALAHEMGHALLPPLAHASTGVMQARWEGDDIRHAAVGLLSFNQQEAGMIRDKADRRCALP